MSVSGSNAVVDSVDATVVSMPMPFLLPGNSFPTGIQMNRRNDVLTLTNRFWSRRAAVSPEALAAGASLTIMFGMVTGRAWVVVLTLSAGAAVLAAFWTGRSTRPEPIAAFVSAPASLAVAPAPAGPMAGSPGADPSARSATNVATASSAANPRTPAIPPGVTASQWHQLTAEMQDRADGPAELQRLAAYFEWSDLLRRFREARTTGGGTGGQVPALVQPLAEGLDERLRLRELSAAEALRVKGAILEATVTDPVERQQRLQEWADALIGPVTPITPAAADPRQPQFDRNQAAIVAAWSAQSASLRDRVVLERQLDALRTQTFTRTAP